ncbi:MAG: hypothetical protein AAFR23_10975, partial [Pseudomonadota bacterium]
FQGGTYYRALVGFMKSVCGLSAVRCVTYRTLTEYMDALSAEQRKRLQAGQFKRQRTTGQLTFDVADIWQATTDQIKQARANR